MWIRVLAVALALSAPLQAEQRATPILPPEPPPMSDETIKENERVTVSLKSNEVTIRGNGSFVDPVKVRLGSVWHTKGVISFELQRRDGEWEEIATVTVRQDERERHDPYTRTGELEIAIRHDQPGVQDDPQFIPVALFRWDGIRLFVPLFGVGGAADGAVPGRLYSGDGKVCLNLQSDQRGGVVLYDTDNGNLDERRWRPVWALRNGVLENFP